MNDMNITVAKYSVDPDGNNISVQATINGQDWAVPLDPANRHYAEIMRQVEDGSLVIEPAGGEQ